jgi:hypothetical protein
MVASALLSKGSIKKMPGIEVIVSSLIKKKSHEIIFSM